MQYVAPFDDEDDDNNGSDLPPSADFLHGEEEALSPQGLNTSMKSPSLAETLNTIQKTKIGPLQKGSVGTVKEFWDVFVQPFLPKKETIAAWHHLLKAYVHVPDACFAIRAFSGAKNMRRSFYTVTDAAYSFFYTDNFFAAYFAKMAHDNYVPTLQEMVGLFHARLFPSRFGKTLKEERELAAIPQGKNPGISNAGYKLSHVFDVGSDYLMSGRKLTSFARDVLEPYYPKGERADWKMTHDATGDYYRRSLSVKPEARRLLTAHFLRFVHPLNYFLSPGCNHHICGIKVFRNDIGESPELRAYISQRYEAIYGDIYRELKELMLVCPFSNSPVADEIPIPIKFDFRIKKTGGKHPEKVETSTAKPVLPPPDAAAITKAICERLRNGATIDICDEACAYGALVRPNYGSMLREKEAQGKRRIKSEFIKAFGFNAFETSEVSINSLIEKIADCFKKGKGLPQCFAEYSRSRGNGQPRAFLNNAYMDLLRNIAASARNT